MMLLYPAALHVISRDSQPLLTIAVCNSNTWEAATQKKFKGCSLEVT
jgi:hypothetical protein